MSGVSGSLEVTRISWGDRSASQQRCQCLGLVILSQDPHPAHFPEARNSGQEKDCGAGRHLPSAVVINPLIFISNTLDAANPSRYMP